MNNAEDDTCLGNGIVFQGTSEEEDKWFTMVTELNDTMVPAAEGATLRMDIVMSACVYTQCKDNFEEVTNT